MDTSARYDRKRKQPHGDDFNGNVAIRSRSNGPRVPAAQDQAPKISTRSTKQSRMNQQAEQIDVEQTQPAQAQNHINAELQQLRNREQKHVAYEQSLKEGYNTSTTIIAQLQAQIIEKNAMISRVQAENRELIKSRQEDAQIINNVTMDHRCVEQQFERLEIDKRQLKYYIDNLTEERQQIRAEKNELIQVIEGYNKDNREFRLKIQQLQDEKIQMAERVVDVRNANAGLQVKTCDIEAKVQQLKEDKNQLSERVAIAHNNNVRLNAMVPDLEAQIQQLKTDQEKLIKIINSDEHAAIGEERQCMQSQKDALAEAIETFEQVKESIVTKVREQALENMSDFIKGKSVKHQLQIRQLQSEKDELVKIIDSLNKNAAILRSENTTLAKASKENEIQYRQCDFRLLQLQGETIKLREFIKTLGNRNAALEADNSKLRTKVSDICTLDKLRANMLTALQTDSAALREQVETLTKVAEEFDHEQDGLLKQIDELNNANQELKAENHALHEEVEDLSRQAEEFDDAQDEAYAEIERLKQKERIYTVMDENQLFEASRQHQAPQSTVGTQTTTQTTIGDALNQIESSKQQFTQEIQRNTASEKQLRDIIFGLECDKSELQGQVDRMEVEAAESTDRVAIAEKELRAEMAETKEATGAKQQIEKLMDEKMDVYMQWRAEVKELKENVQEGLDANNVLREHIGILEDQIQKMIAERSRSMSPDTAYNAWAKAISRKSELDGQEDQDDMNSETDTKSTATLVEDSDSPAEDEEDWTRATHRFVDYYATIADSDAYDPPQFDAGNEQTESEADPVSGSCPTSEDPEIDGPEYSDFDSDCDCAGYDSAAYDYASDDDGETTDNDNVNESTSTSEIDNIKSFLAQVARQYLTGLISHNDFKMGNISADEHREQEATLFLELDMVKRTPSQEHALEVWTKMRNEMRGIGNGDRQMEFLRESVRVMEERREEEEVLEEVLARLPSAGKRRREDEVVESWVERASGPQSKRRRVE
ncbi:hypothetical protein N431DRAFT_440927 [Stipitochalara longipes BDJ]|nr:hypothetical protein N431DRAFT_440927 [Stipitochalara longipes BDJ]